MTAPQISVVIPVRNGERYLGEAIESALGQRDVDAEVIVVDDGSTDGSAAIARSFPEVELITQPHRGVGAARNLGWDNARSPLIGYLDADDLWDSHKLSVQAEFLYHREDLEAAGAYVKEFVSPDLSAEERAGLEARSGRHSAPLPSTLLFRRVALERIGLFRESREEGAALDFALRMSEAGMKWEVAEGFLVHRRLHATNRTRVARDIQQREYLKAIKRSLDRRRSLPEQT